MDIRDAGLLRLIQAWTGCGLWQAEGLVSIINRYNNGEYTSIQIDKLFALRHEEVEQ